MYNVGGYIQQSCTVHTMLWLLYNVVTFYSAEQTIKCCTAHTMLYNAVEVLQLHTDIKMSYISYLLEFPNKVLIPMTLASH